MPRSSAERDRRSAEKYLPTGKEEDYEKQKNAGLDPLFDPETVGIKDEANVWGPYVEKKKARGDYKNPDLGYIKK